MQLFDSYLQPQATLYQVAKWLTELGVATPTGKPRWNAASVRGILRNPAYTGRALTKRTQVTPARQRRSPLLPVGPGQSHAPRPQQEWITVAVPQIVPEETFAQVQAKLDANQQTAARNTRHEFLLRTLVSCGVCRLSCIARQTQGGYRYYLCRGHTDALRAAQGQRCTARYIPRRTAGRAGLGRFVRAADRSRSGRPRAEPSTERGLAASRAAGQAGDHRQRPRPAATPAATATGRLPGRGHHAGRARTQAARTGPPPRHARGSAAAARRHHPAAARALSCRRRDRNILPVHPRRAGNRHLQAAAAAGRVAHRPRDRHRQRNRDSLRPPDLPRRPASPFLPVALKTISLSQRSW